MVAVCLTATFMLLPRKKKISFENKEDLHLEQELLLVLTFPSVLQRSICAFILVMDVT